MSSSARVRIDLYYDVVSPYSLFAFEILHRYEKVWNIDLKLIPIYLGGIMAGSDNKPPATNPSKAVYLNKDLPRLSSLYSIPTRQPADFSSVMLSTLKAQRLLTALSIKYPSSILRDASRKFWEYIWQKDIPVNNESAMKEVLTAAGIKDEEEQNKLLKYSESAEIKGLLKNRTDYLVKELFAFGAPILLIYTEKPSETSQKITLPNNGGDHIIECIFGSDRFELIGHLLNKPYLGPNPNSNQKSKL